MQFTAERATLAQALSHCGRAISARNSLPILSHVLIATGDDQLKLTATDLDISISCRVPASVAGKGAVALPAAPLSDYISKLPDAPVTLELLEDRCTVRCGKSRLTLLSAPAQDYPVTPDISSNDGFCLPANQLKEMIAMTSFAASKEASRSLLMGVLIEASATALRMVATDSHRLAYKEAKLESGPSERYSAIVPASALKEVATILKGDAPVTVRASDAQIQFESEAWSLTSRVLDGQFPDYEKVIPKTTERTITVDRAEWLSAIRRIDIVSRSASNKFEVAFTGGSMAMEASSPQDGQTLEEIPIALDGDDLKCAYNAKYLVEVLGLAKADQLTLSLNGALQPGILRAGDDFTYIIMPMAL